MRQTREEGYEEGELSGRLKAYREMSVSKEDAIEKIMKAYSLSAEKAWEMMEKYWTSDNE